jgi:hypothetical protein
MKFDSDPVYTGRMGFPRPLNKEDDESLAVPSEPSPLTEQIANIGAIDVRNPR